MVLTYETQNDTCIFLRKFYHDSERMPKIYGGRLFFFWKHALSKGFCAPALALAWVPGPY